MARRVTYDPYGAEPDPNYGWEPQPAMPKPAPVAAPVVPSPSSPYQPGVQVPPAVDPREGLPYSPAPAAPVKPVGNLEGFDEGKLNDPAHTTIKYRAARVFRQFTPASFVSNPGAVIAALKAAGLSPTLIGKDKIDFGDGFGPVDVVRGSNLGGDAWAWQPVETASEPSAATPGSLGALADDPGGKSGIWREGDPAWQAAQTGGVKSPLGANGATGIDPSYLAPWTGQFNAPAGAANPAYPSWDTTGEFQGPGEFRAPTAESMLADPSYQWRVNQGMGAIENSAASRGVLNSGGTLADIANYGQGAASQEYQNIWNRDLSKWNSDWANSLNKFQTNFGASEADKQRQVMGYNAATGNARDAYNRAWQQFGDQKDTWYKNQDNAFSKIRDMAALGANASQ